jgi:hypothetical protein
MRPTMLWTIPLAAVLAACDSPTRPDPLSVDPPIQAAVLPSSTNATARAIAPVLSVEQVSKGEGQIIGWCDEAAGVGRESAPGAGTATHIGHFEVLQTHCIDFATGAVTGGVATLTAADGDEIHFTYDGQFVPEVAPPTVDLLYTVTSGTGRFTNSTGEIAMRVMQTSQTTWTSRGTGWISYLAEDRSTR